jgi:hypothetical protein
LGGLCSPWSVNGEKRQPNEKSDIGGNDAELIALWPGLLYNHTRDDPMWAVWAVWAVSGAWRSARCAPALRVVNNVPLLKRRMIAAEHRFRGIDQAPQGH